jgi:uncharacterized protein (DUF4415 family)
MPKRKSSGVKRIKDLQMEQLLRDYPEMRKRLKEIFRDVRGHLSKGGARAKRPLERKGVIPLKRPRTGTGAPWVNPDDAPELTKEYFERADLYHGDKLIRRGRPPSENPKQAIKLRIDADVVEYFRATGPGWQTRINEALRRAAKLKRSA